MDTVLKEPKQVTSTGGYEGDVEFSADGKELWFTSTRDGQCDVWKATRKDIDKYWWENTGFDVQQITNDAHVESDLRFDADGLRLIMQQGRGNLVSMNVESKEKTTLVKGFSGIDYDLSPDGQWIAYSKQDDDFNRDIWIAKLDGSIEPINVSRHPDNDGNPKFSADGKMLAFTGRRVDREVDIYFVYLQEEDSEETSRDRKIQEARELMEKKRKEEPNKKVENDNQDKDQSKRDKKNDEKAKKVKASAEENKEKTEKDSDGDETDEEESEEEELEVKIDLDGIHQRVRKLSIPNSTEDDLLFSPDGQKLAFAATIDGKRGWYTVEFPDELKPKLLTSSIGSSAVWSSKADGILFLRNGSPSKVDKGGKLETYSFKLAQTLSRSAWLKAGFDRAWLTMRESWYDKRFANRNWDDVRRKYSPVAAEMFDTEGLADVIELMLGELNGSHLGFYPSGRQERKSEGWKDETAHLGVRFVEDYNGPGLKVRDVIRNGPADRETSKLKKDDVILSIDGTVVDPAMDLTRLLNGRLDRDISLKVKRESDEADDELTVPLRPISFSKARSLLYEQWLDHNRGWVDDASDGKLGYLHIRAMNMSSFYEFERQLFNVGYGREGLVIDVRDNGGGSTTDLLLTALTQPRHAITQPRGGGQGYPHDRAVFASWKKPIIVLCNQNSYSNAEIFSHAIKTLGRGKVVGVQTAGGVISTGSASVNDVGRIRVPFRGWFVVGTGQDMEQNGCVPDEIVHVRPGELPRGTDRQLKRAVEILLDEVGDGATEKELIYASERDDQ